MEKTVYMVNIDGASSEWQEEITEGEKEGGG